MKITRRQLGKIINEAIQLTETKVARAAAIASIAKRLGGKKLKSPQSYPSVTEYEFPNDDVAAKACKAIHDETGRRCVRRGPFVRIDP